MTDRLVSFPSRNRLSRAARERARSLRQMSGTACQVGDMVSLGLAGLGMAAGWRPMAALTVRNLILAILCLGTWRMILFSVGMYDATRVRSPLDYGFRCLIALNSAAAVVGLVKVVLHQRAGVWHALLVFWTIGFLLMSLTRGLLLLQIRVTSR